MNPEKPVALQATCTGVAVINIDGIANAVLKHSISKT